MMLVRCLVAVLDSFFFKLVSCVCVEPWLRLEHALYETCLVLHVFSSCHVASMFWSVCDVALLVFASMPCLTCFAHIFQSVAPN